MDSICTDGSWTGGYVDVSFGGSFLGGGVYSAGYALALKRENAGKLYVYDNYEFEMGLHADGSINIGGSYFFGQDKDFYFDKAFGGAGGSIEADYLGGVSLGFGQKDKKGNYLMSIGIGAGASIGGGLGLGKTNLREINP